MTGAAGADRGAAVPFPPPLMYLGWLLAGVGLHLALDLGEPPVAVRIAGAVVGIGAFIYFDSGAMQRFRRAGTSPIPWRPSSALVVDGPYRLTRNPMYVGMAFLFAGLAFALGTLLALVFLPAAILTVDRVVIAREEPYLERLFGADYVAYKRRVRRWL